jgi:hypothetical protein
MIRLAPLLLLAACAGGVRPEAQTAADRCVNAERIVLAMEIGGAWQFSIDDARQTAAEICGGIDAQA